MDLFTVTIGVSILIYIVIGSYAGRSVKKLDDYFVAGRRAPTLLILGTLVASVMSTAIFMGEAAFTYDGQFGAYLLFPGIAVTGYMLGALFFVGKRRLAHEYGCTHHAGNQGSQDQKRRRSPSGDKIVVQFFYAASGIAADHNINQNTDTDRYGK